MVRIKHRYLVCSLHLDAEGGGDISERHIHHAVRDAIQANYGEHGAGVFGMVTMVKFYDPALNLFLLRAPREHASEVWASLTFITAIAGVPVTISVLHSAGSSRTCRNALLSIIRDVAPPGVDAARYHDVIQQLDI